MKARLLIPCVLALLALTACALWAYPDWPPSGYSGPALSRPTATKYTWYTDEYNIPNTWRVSGQMVVAWSGGLWMWDTTVTPAVWTGKGPLYFSLNGSYYDGVNGPQNELDGVIPRSVGGYYYYCDAQAYIYGEGPGYWRSCDYRSQTVESP